MAAKKVEVESTREPGLEWTPDEEPTRPNTPSSIRMRTLLPDTRSRLVRPEDYFLLARIILQRKGK